MRPVKYSVAMSLDGYIADQDGGYDWIIMDPAIDFAAFYATFDTVLVGRRTFEIMNRGGPGLPPGTRTYVFSRTLRPEDHPGVTIVADDAEATISALRVGTGKDIWLMGGGDLFRSLLGAGLVDAVEVSIVPTLLGGGVPLLPPPAKSARLELTRTHTYPSGIVSLSYSVDRTSA